MPLVPSPDGSAATRGAKFKQLLARRHGGLVLFGVVFLTISLLTRVALVVKAAGDVSWSQTLLAAFGWGLIYDLGAAAWAGLPVALALTLLPEGFFSRACGRTLAWGAGLVVMVLLVFGGISEWVFWDEFGVRFNFIAVDYLVYTTEVLGNIRESYNMPLILAGVGALASLGLWLLARTGWPTVWFESAVEPAGRRWRNGMLWLVGMIAFGSLISSAWQPEFRNNYNREIGKNGLWSLFAAFRSNVLDYDQFYRTQPVDKAFARLREELTEDGSVLLNPNKPDPLRYVRNTGPEQHLNVIQITVESLSGEFLGVLNPESKLTPYLDALAAKSLFFDNFYATGNRTDRGMEALTLSLPPTPGRSLVKRPNNENLFTLGSVFRSRGYDTAFLYGGYGYFDNMNHFFGENGYRVVDRAAVAREDITFANAWGACDEDVFRWTAREADAAHAADKPFHFFVMTTSNHRPFTYPDGRIDLPSKISGRAGAVKYTDYAIGEFIKSCESKPWFKNTVFVVVADHCASSAGKADLPVPNYHIPLIIYAPGGQIAPGRISTLSSQIDYAPTLLGLLNWSYPSRFFGHDVRRVEPREAHALIANYQKLGHLEDNTLLILKPQHTVSAYRLEADRATLTPLPAAQDAEDEAIAFYQSASYLYKHGLYRALSAEEISTYSQMEPQKKVAQHH